MALVASVEVRLAVALAAVAEVCPALAARPAVALVAAVEAQAAALAAAVALEEERNNDVESTHHAWTSYTATRRSLNYVRGGIVGTISAN